LAFVLSNESFKIEFEHVLTHEKIEFEVSGEKLQYVTIPVGYQHRINNIGNDELVLILWANELFDPEKSDTYTISFLLTGHGTVAVSALATVVRKIKKEPEGS
jgi:oxalate decarboxylase/phosphoglucose isomerase-like protein (cupin superfamily)